MLVGRASLPARARFRFGFRLATLHNSLALGSRSTLRHWSRDLRNTLSDVLFGLLRPFHALAICNHAVSGLFTPVPRELFSFRSRYLCAIGLPAIFRLG